MDIGDKFPNFVLMDENEEIFDNKELKGVRYVIYFYSKDGSPSCTKEAIEFNELYVKFMLRNIPIIAVSKDKPSTHKKFKDKNSLKIKLLSDPNHSLMEDTEVWGKKMMFGKELYGTIRSTFIVGKDGKIEATWKKVKVEGHAEKVLNKAKSLSKSA